ncbi:MAG: M43 family zinc metalloprotease [Bacteroidia bacterium]
MKKHILLGAFTVLLSAANAQEPDGCITHKAMNDYFNQHPAEKKAFEARQAELEKQDAIDFKNGYKNIELQRGNGQNETQGTVYYIPVVFQILHQNGPENISDAQAIACVAEMNQRYRKLNADTANTISQFKGIASDVQIEFRLATKDPSGNCTNGINRYVDPHTVWLQGNTSWYTHTWDPRKYLNIYVVKSINGTAAAYTYLPGTWASGAAPDVIVARYDYTGSTGASQASHGFCISHEAGHWLNLQHTWGNTNNPGVACGNDGVADTPITEGSNLVCNLSMANCTSGVVENVQNYMDYSYCSTMFTAGQVARMRAAIVSTTSGRNNVITTANQQATGILTYSQVCVPVANFHGNPMTGCTGATITFSDSSSNAHVTSWHWNFPGGTMVGASTVNDSMPKVSYATPGTYAVSYTATTSAGSNSITRNGYITINSNIASHNTAFYESFETASVPGADWNLQNSGGVNWAVTSLGAATGSKSVYVDNFSSAPGNTNSLLSNSFDLSGFASPKLTFKMAYQQAQSANVDKLQIFTSTDCGNNWISRWSRSGSTLATVTPPSGFPLSPTPSQFTTYTVNINGVYGNPNVRFKFEFFADTASTGPGNYIFLDDINIFDASAGISSLEAKIGLEVYPNPSADKFTIAFTSSEKHSASVTVTDVLGRTVESTPVTEFPIGENKIMIGEKVTYQPGVYLMNLKMDGQTITKKVIIE